MTIPSQRRYVNYYSMLVQENLNYKPVVLTIKEIKLNPVPTMFNSGQTCMYKIQMYCKHYIKVLYFTGIRIVISEWTSVDSSKIRKVYSSNIQDIRRTDSDVTICLTQTTQVRGDVKVECYNKHKMKKKV